jgi:dihydropteroate synthase
MIRIGNRNFYPENNTYIMGILNITPDSFSDGGEYNTLTAAMEHTRKMIEAGADIIDVGGESTRPGFVPVSAKEEIKRVVPIIRAIRSNFDIPVSLDTTKGEVARAGIDAGADMINDVCGLKGDDEMPGVIARSGLPVCICHNVPHDDDKSYMSEFIADLRDMIAFASENGIDGSRIIIDPGIGFAKSLEQNLEIISKLDMLKELDKPVLVGLSRKSFIGNILEADVDNRLAGTLASDAWAVLHGAGFLRVHDVKEHVDMVRVLSAIMSAGTAAIRKYRVYIAYGSNMGNRQGYIDKAIRLLNADPQIKIISRSSTIETAPYGGVIQSDFLNGVICIDTTYGPEELLTKTQSVERECDRVRSEHWGPRTLDLDILFYDDKIIDTDRLTVPHPDMHNREFVLRPLCEIAPEMIHPVMKKTVKQLLEQLQGRVM